MANSLSFSFSVKLLIFPSYLNEILAERVILVVYFSFPLTSRVPIERSAVVFMGTPLCVICCFSLAAFNICPLCLIFVSLIIMCLGVFCLGVILFGTLWVS